MSLNIRRSNWRAARASLERAAELAPDNAVALTMLASMETQMIPLVPFHEIAADTDRAMALCERAVEFDPTSDWVLRTRGNVRLWLLGNRDGARLDCAPALAINPAFHLAHLTMATCDILTGAFDAGASRLEEMIRRAPFDSQNFLYFSLIALARLLNGDIGRALEMAKEGHERNPSASWNALVYCTIVGGNHEVASTYDFQRMLKRIDLDASHFPFKDKGISAYLSSRARAAGVG